MYVLYHASTNPDLKVLEPQRTLSNDKYIGDFVFATADKILAAMYLLPKGYGSILDTDTKPPQILIRADETEVRAKDKGGAIYTVDASDFSESPQKDLIALEKVSDKPIIPISKEIFKNSFDALNKLGIEVEFIDQKTFDRLATK
jgi:hypothetical protein